MSGREPSRAEQRLVEVHTTELAALWDAAEAEGLTCRASYGQLPVACDPAIAVNDVPVHVRGAGGDTVFVIGAEPEAMLVPTTEIDDVLVLIQEEVRRPSGGGDAAEHPA